MRPEQHILLSEITNWDKIIFDKSNNAYFIKQNEIYKYNKEGDFFKIGNITFNGLLNNYIFVENDNNDKVFLFLLKENEIITARDIKIDKNFEIKNDYKYFIDKKNNVYFFSNNQNNIYVLKNNTDTFTKINGIDKYNKIEQVVIDKNYNFYIKAIVGIYFLKNGENKANLIKGTNTLIEYIEIDKFDNIYFISNENGLWRLKLEHGNIKNNLINLNKLITLSFYLPSIIGRVKDINIDNLIFSDIEVTSASNSLKLIDEKSVCFKPVNFSNGSSSGAQKIKIPSCNYETKVKYLFQITTGLNINNSKNIVKGWNLNIDDEMILTDFTSSNKKASEIKNTLSEDFDLSNTNKQEQELVLNRDLLHSPEQELSVQPKQSLTAQYVIRLLSIETNLDLKQKISGTITAKIVKDNNEEQTITLSIKEAMQILQKHSLLPNEITINEDNSITFNGKAIISRTSESDPKPIFNFRPI